MKTNIIQSAKERYMQEIKHLAHEKYLTGTEFLDVTQKIINDYEILINATVKNFIKVNNLVCNLHKTIEKLEEHFFAIRGRNNSIIAYDFKNGNKNFQNLRSQKHAK